MRKLKRFPRLIILILSSYKENLRGVIHIKIWINDGAFILMFIDEYKMHVFLCYFKDFI